MAGLEIANLTFTYPGRSKPALRDLNLTLEQGDFAVLCGPSGGGKTTLLRLLKPVIAPFGRREGKMLYHGRDLSELSAVEEATMIGFVRQDVDNQIVTDTVWHELAFGLENQGMASDTIRLRVAEIANHFGMQTWFRAKVSDLSGGQKQLLNLAAVMVMQPQLLLLDEPCAQLDPIAAADFLTTIARINREFGVSVLLSEHRLEETLPFCDRLLVLDEGKLIAVGEPREISEQLRRTEHSMFSAMPTPMRCWSALPSDLPCPLSVDEGRRWLAQQLEVNILSAEAQDFRAVTAPRMQKQHCTIQSVAVSEEKQPGKVAAVLQNKPVASLTCEDLWFRYGKDSPDTLRGLSFAALPGQLTVIVGGNASGKTTLLQLIAGLKKPYRGSIKFHAPTSAAGAIKASAQIPGGRQVQDTDRVRVALLPQDPRTLFIGSSVGEDLSEALLTGRHASNEAESYRQKLQTVAATCGLGELLAIHPYDLSGGEQQKLALAKVLLREPEILLLDEPTKGMDAHFKRHFAAILTELKEKGLTIIMVSHDLEFCAEYADSCALLFDGYIIAQSEPQGFFSGNSFYTTAANRMSRGMLPNAITSAQIIQALGVQVLDWDTDGNDNEAKPDERELQGGEPDPPTEESGAGESSGSIIVSAPSCAAANRSPNVYRNRVLLALAVYGIAVPLTIWGGVTIFSDRRFYLISLLILVETLIPFAWLYESRRPQAREISVIAVLSAIAVAGRSAFFMLPQIKPMAAVTIIDGVSLGGEAGFMVGALSAFISNIFFGQGPWTPWQMLAFGCIGFLAGVLQSLDMLQAKRIQLAIYGGLATLVIYGGIMNPVSVLLWQSQPSRAMIIAAFISGLPFDVIHALSTVAFLLITAEPLLARLDRLKTRYGLRL